MFDSLIRKAARFLTEWAMKVCSPTPSPTLLEHSDNDGEVNLVPQTDGHRVVQTEYG